MSYVRKDSREKLQILKESVERSHEYFKNNYKRYNDSVRFVCKSTMTGADLSAATELDRPQVEFNIIEAHQDRLCGEFAKMDPMYSIRKKEGSKLKDDRVPEVVEAYIKAEFFGGDKDSLSVKLYEDALRGGFSVAKIYTDYENAMSFEQKIFVERVYDPTLCGFDPLARQSHKGDGRYCYEIFPRAWDDAIDEFGEEVIQNLDFSKSIGGFSWSYENQKEKIILFCEFYEKVFKKTKILKLANGSIVTQQQYDKVAKLWADSGEIEQMPAIVSKRETMIEHIDKYLFTGGKVIQHTKTDYGMLPLVFFDGKSVMIRENQEGPAEQFTKPYAYNARDAQRLKNIAGQSLCNELETMVQHKWIVPIEGIPDNADYQYAYTMPQRATVMVYNQFKDNDPQVPINPPREVIRAPVPPELMNTFVMCDKLIQTILGTYDAAMGMQGNDVTSGKAMREGAINSNAASMPYMMGFINGWNRLITIFVNLLPKYVVTPRTIPVVYPTGKRGFYEINSGKNVHFSYGLDDLEVTVETGVNFEVQKQIALEMLLKMMQSSEIFSQFMNQEGLEVLLDNLDIRGVDNLKLMAEQFMQKLKKQQEEQQQQQASMPKPDQIMQIQMQQEQEKNNIEKAKIQQKQSEAELKAQVQMTEIQVNASEASKEADIKFIEAMSKIQGAELDRAIQQEKVDAENARTELDMAVDMSRHQLEQEKHAIDIFNSVQGGSDNQE